MYVVVCPRDSFDSKYVTYSITMWRRVVMFL